jgi:hypothetical protein
MQNTGVKMELQRNGVNGHWDQNGIIQKEIVVYAARVAKKARFSLVKPKLTKCNSIITMIIELSP